MMRLVFPVLFLLVGIGGGAANYLTADDPSLLFGLYDIRGMGFAAAVGVAVIGLVWLALALLTGKKKTQSSAPSPKAAKPKRKPARTRQLAASPLAAPAPHPEPVRAKSPEAEPASVDWRNGVAERASPATHASPAPEMSEPASAQVGDAEDRGTLVFTPMAPAPSISPAAATPAPAAAPTPTPTPAPAPAPTAEAVQAEPVEEKVDAEPEPRIDHAARRRELIEQGEALLASARITKSPEDLKRAGKALEDAAALGDDMPPEDKAQLYRQIGDVHQMLALAEDDNSELDAAITAFLSAKSALADVHRPAHLAQIQRLLANVLRLKGKRLQDRPLLQEAAEELRSALSRLSPDMHAPAWTATNTLLALTLEDLGDLEPSPIERYRFARETLDQLQEVNGADASAVDQIVRHRQRIQTKLDRAQGALVNHS